MVKANLSNTQQCISDLGKVQGYGLVVQGWDQESQDTDEIG